MKVDTRMKSEFFTARHAGGVVLTIQVLSGVVEGRTADVGELSPAEANKAAPIGSEWDATRKSLAAGGWKVTRE